MSAESMPAAPPARAGRVQRAARTFPLHLPLVIGAFAAAGAFGPLSAAPLDGPQAMDRARATRLVEDAQSLVQPDGFGGETVSMLMSPPPVPAALPAQETTYPPAAQASSADRLRGDPVQTARVPPDPEAKPLPTVKLTKDERAISRYITRSYRVAGESVDRFVHYAFKAAREFRLDPHLILAVMAVESGFNPNAESPAGAQGLMQVHTKVHTSKFEPFGGAEAAYDPLVNIKVGARILSDYVRRYGDVAAGLKAYVGAALLSTDGGYGSKVLSRQAEFDAVVRPEVPPATAAKADLDAEPAASTETSATAPARSVSVGL